MRARSNISALLIVIIILMGMLSISSCRGSGSETILPDGDDIMSSPARWTATPSTIPLPGGRAETALNRVGCYQKIALEHEDGRTFVVCATESAAVPGTVLRIAVSESVNADKTWVGGGADYNTAVESTIANGYTNDEIVGLREWSADIRGNVIYIATLSNVAGNIQPSLIYYSIDNQTFTFINEYTHQLNFDIFNVDSLSIDIALKGSGCLRDINKDNVCEDKIWLGFTAVGDLATYPSLRCMPTMYQIEIMLPSAGGSLTQAQMTGAGATITGQDYEFYISLFDGGNSIYAVRMDDPTDVLSKYYFYTWFDSLVKPVVPNGIGGVADYVWFYPTPYQMSSALDAGYMLYTFGCWDACYIDRYSYQVQAKWLRNAGNTGWDLYIGRRNINGVFNAQLVKTVDYANLGVADIENEVEALGIVPEVNLSVDEEGMVYCIFMYPDMMNNVFSGTGLGALDGYPYTNIEMVTMDGDTIYNPQNLDIQTVWNGFQDLTYRSLKHMSASHRTDTQDFDQPSDRRIWVSVRDNYNGGRIVLYRN